MARTKKTMNDAISEKGCEDCRSNGFCIEFVNENSGKRREMLRKSLKNPLKAAVL